MTDWPPGGGEMARRIRAHDWAATPLGPIAAWPQSLKTAVDLMLASGHAMQLAWGPERIVLYNDAYAPMLGSRHPHALGIPFREAWPDVWDEIEPLVRQVFAGETVRFDDMPLVMTRRGYPEDTWWNFSYSPVRDEAGAIAGLLNVTVDATGQHRADAAERERDAANARLRDNEARFRALVTAGANSIYRMSPDWRLMYQLDSQSLANTTAPIENWVDKYIPQEDLPAVLHAMETAIRTKSLFQLEHRVHLADGGVGWVLSRAVPLLGPDGEITEWFGAGSDVTDRREATERLHKSEEQYREMFGAAERRAAELGAVIESMGDAVYMGDAQGINLANQAALDQLGYASQEELDRRIGLLAQEIQTRDAATGEEMSEQDQPFSRALQGERVVRNVKVRHRLTGEERIVRTSASPVVSGGRVLGAVAVNTDITSAVRAVEEIRLLEERQAFLLKFSDALRPIADPARIKVVATGLLGEQLAVHRAFYADADNGHWIVTRGFERDIEPLPERPFEMSACGDWIVEAFQAGQSVVIDDMATDPRLGSQERDAHLALQIRAEVALPLVKNGQLVAMLVVHSAAPRAWSGPDLALLEEVAQRTWSAVARARAETALHLADRRKDEFLAVLAHELRNGLAPMVYNAEIGSRSLADPALLQQLSARTGRQLRHVVRLVDDLLDVARINNGKIQLDLELVKAREIVSQALDACRADIDRKHHRLAIIEEADSELAVRGDRVRLTQVVSNLLSNATKYTDGGGTITVRIAREGEEAVIEVSDTGIGIPAAALPQVFDLFTQVRNQQAYSAGGLGIGLALVKQLVEMQGGRATAASGGPGQGSTFTVRLPVASATAVELAEAAAADASSALRALRVLVVDDLRDSADSLAQLLCLEGHDAEAAYSGKHALENARRRRPDLVLLDLGMPGMDGFEVARRLRDEFTGEPAMQIVALTGWGQESDRQKTRAASFDGHLAKPPSSADLQAVLAAAPRLPA
ncbi:PAS domain-containing protein [Ramlibacter sp. G-1-2-2]|uniref:histidine kinase n=1 Tax=Ramlibacter agri TaxID=2728837 RepID=A0A848GY78_9BURK|nr:PAS domain-containing protein [Ramlibacter agri]NML43294.1 PAS domain-containing protein [Ramlibacter agri]